MTYQIGTQTTLTDREWVKAFLATLDEDADHTHDTYVFLKNNRHESDDGDAELEAYAALCKEHGTEF